LVSNNEALHYAVFFRLPLICKHSPRHHFSVYELSNAWQTEFHTHTKQELCIVDYYNYAETLHCSFPTNLNAILGKKDVRLIYFGPCCFVA
jgi:hypothetical protein